MRTSREVGVFVHRGGRLLVLHRSEDRYWHIIAGVVEPSETYLAAATRELLEESGLRAEALLDLEVPVAYAISPELRDRYGYPDDVPEVVVHSFAVDVAPGWEPVLNEEHDEYRWCDIDEAIGLLHWPETRAAARVLAHRLGLQV